MKKFMLISAAALLVSTSAMAQSTVVTTTGAGHGAAVQIDVFFWHRFYTGRVPMAFCAFSTAYLFPDLFL